jgi:hypothetical protein
VLRFAECLGRLARQIVAIAQDLEPKLFADSVIASRSLAGDHHRREEPVVPFGPDRRCRRDCAPSRRRGHSRWLFSDDRLGRSSERASQDQMLGNAVFDQRYPLADVVSALGWH